VAVGTAADVLAAMMLDGQCVSNNQVSTTQISPTPVGHSAHSCVSYIGID